MGWLVKLLYCESSAAKADPAVDEPSQSTPSLNADKPAASSQSPASTLTLYAYLVLNVESRRQLVSFDTLGTATRWAG